ncbi:MAG: LD-carboxypeptidase [Polyangiales bacterium]
MIPCVRPAPLSPGASLRVVAASSPFERERYVRGLALLRTRYTVSEGRSLFAKRGFLAGDDDLRLHDLRDALGSDAHAIVPPRGGYGATRLLPSLDVDEVSGASKWLVGFSDVTALHALWARAGLCSIHGPMVCSLPEASVELQRRWFALLEGAPPPPLTELTSVIGGRAEGRLFGGNLSVLAALIGTPYFPDLTDTVLALEDVGERPYRLDRMLTTMLQAGVLTGVRAVILGRFTRCDPGPDGTSADDVLAEQLGSLGVPVVRDAPFGHVHENTPLLLGAHATVDATYGRVDFQV